MATNTVFPPQPCVPATLSAAAQTLTAALGLSATYPNRGGIQIKAVSTNGSSVFYNLTAATCTLLLGDEIPAGTAQVITPAMAPDTDRIFVIGNNLVLIATFLGG